MLRLFSSLTLLFITGFCFAQQPEEDSLRLQRAEEFFKSALIKHFIHPNQLEQKSWRECQSSIKNLVEKFEDNFIEIRIEKAFNNADVTNYFSAIFIYEDGREFILPAFKIMQ